MAVPTTTSPVTAFFSTSSTPTWQVTVALRHFGNRLQALAITAVSLFLLLGGVLLLIR